MTNNLRDLFDNYGKDKKSGDAAKRAHPLKSLSSDPPRGEKRKQKEAPYLPNKVNEEEVSVDTLLADLDALIGLDRVKAEVRDLVNLVYFNQTKTAKGFKTASVSMHTVFYGSPGTGKTTVARVYGQILKALGLLSKGHVVETDRAGLVANYIGQTANKTDEKVREALGGVLFIDEAYSLYTGDESKWDYGAEAIQVLVKRMEDYREDLVVIVAGYPEPMNEFLDSNEGFKSRFPRYLHFDDYLPEQLLEILRKFCREGDNKLEPAATEKVTEVIQQACDKRGKSFGNARYVRNIYEKMVRHRATRLAQSGKFTDYALQHFDPADVEPLLESKRIEDSVGGDERPIGFRRSRD